MAGFRSSTGDELGLELTVKDFREQSHLNRDGARKVARAREPGVAKLLRERPGR